MGSGVSQNTRLTYRSGANSFRRWCESAGLRGWWPPRERHICLWLTHLATQTQPKTNSTLKYSTLKVYLTGLNATMVEDGQIGVRHMKILQVFMKGLKRKLGTHVRKKKPITLDDVRHLDVRSYDDFVMRGVVLVGFYGLLRVSELLSPNMTAEHVTIDDNKELATIFIPKSKTDPFRGGVHVVIPTGPKQLCPTSFLKWSIKLHPTGPIFRLRDGRVVKRANFVRWLKDQLKDAKDEYSAHSLRRGGAMALSAAGCPLHIIKKWGRWESNSVEEYLQLSTSLIKTYASRMNYLQGEYETGLWKQSHLWDERISRFGPSKKISK